MEEFLTGEQVQSLHKYPNRQNLDKFSDPEFCKTIKSYSKKIAWVSVM